MAADWINTTAPVYSDAITYVRKPVQALAATFLFLSAPIPTGTHINVPIASVSLTAIAPVANNSVTPMLWVQPPVYVQTEVPVRNNWLARTWILTQPTGSNTYLPLPKASVSLNAISPIPYEAQMWLTLGSDDGIWPDSGETWKLNPNFNFDLLAAPTTGSPVAINLGLDSIVLNAIPPVVSATGNSVTINVSYDTISITGYAPSVSAGNPYFQIPVAQIVLSGYVPYIPLPISTASLSIALTGFSPAILNSGGYIVPNVINSPLTSAETAIVAAQLTVGVITSSYSLGIPLGDVVTQNPAGGSSAGFLSPVNLVISLGTQPGQMPYVIGSFYLKAIQTLSALGLVITVSEQSSATVRPKFVIGQTPAAGSSIVTGQAVALLVSKDSLLSVDTTQPYPLV